MASPPQGGTANSSPLSLLSQHCSTSSRPPLSRQSRGLIDRPFAKQTPPGARAAALFRTPAIMTAFKFGDFAFICEHAALTICPLLQSQHGVMPTCYARNVQLGSQVIFQPGESISSEHQNLRHSNMLCPYRRPRHDSHHAVPHPIQVHGRRAKGDLPFLLHLHARGVTGDLPGLGHHSYCQWRLSGELPPSFVRLLPADDLSGSPRCMQERWAHCTGASW